MNEIYRELTLLSDSVPKVATEIMFEVATARADGTELVRFNILPREDDRLAQRLAREAQRVLKGMKGRGAIQFFATPASIESVSTEYEFIMNKYSEIIEDVGASVDGGSYVYVKL